MPGILTPAELAADPFGEHQQPTAQLRLRLLGANFHFHSASRELLRLAARAYGGLPRHRLGRRPPAIDLRLVLTADAPGARWRCPPPARLLAGTGIVAGVVDAANLVALSPATNAGMVALSPRMLRQPYYARQELLDLAVYTLAPRALGLAALHAGCVAYGRRGLLLLGDSGSGKTTLALQCLTDGFEFLSEDSTFVCPETGLATGLGHYIHVRPDSLDLIPAHQAALLRRHATAIHRRSGVRKLEVDVRALPACLAPAARKLSAVIFLSPEPEGKGPRLRPIPAREALARLTRLQPFAAAQSGWRDFARLAAALPHWELRRLADPGQSVRVLRGLLQART